MHVLIMVGSRIVQPVRALRRILSHGSLQHGYRIIFPRILRVDDLDAFLQQSGRTHVLRPNNDRRARTAVAAVHQTVKALRRGTHAHNQRHGAHMMYVGLKALDKALHDRGSLAGLSALHATVCLVDDEIQPVRLFPRRIVERLPYGIGAAVAVLDELAAFRQLLRVQEIDSAIAQILLVKGLLVNFHALAQAYLARLEHDFISGLRIERGRIRQPDKNSVWLRHVTAHLQVILASLSAVKDTLYQGRHDDGLARTGRCLQGHHLIKIRRSLQMVGAQTIGYTQAQLLDRLFLEGKQCFLHVHALLILMAKLLR